MSTCGRTLLIGLLANCLAFAWGTSAAAFPTSTQETQAKPSPARVASTDDFTHTFQRYGPQATARAVRASLKVALVPDPLCMASLLFCAFSLRWMRMRKERTEQPATPAPNTALPGAA